MPRLPESCAELLKLAERIGDDEGPNKRAKEGASTYKSTKSNSKHQLRKRICQKQKHGKMEDNQVGIKVVLPKEKRKVTTSQREMQVK